MYSSEKEGPFLQVLFITTDLGASPFQGPKGKGEITKQ